MPDEEIFAVQERAVGGLLALPGVTGVGVGGRVRAGRATGELVLKVYVERKRPVAELNPDEVLPTEIEGYGVDVGEAGYAVDFGNPPPAPPVPGARLMGPTDWDTEKKRPLTGGRQCQGDVQGAGLGTLGGMLVDPNENVPNKDRTKVYALTNLHVLQDRDENTGALKHDAVEGTTRVGQSENFDSSTKCCSHLFGTHVKGFRDAVADCAAIKVDGGQTWRAEIEQIGPVRGIAVPLTAADAQSHTYQLRKRGAVTLLTGGVVDSINTHVLSKDGTPAGITRTNVIVMTPNPNRDVRQGQTLFAADHGDSGSLVVNDKSEVVGLLFGGTAALDAQGHALPIINAHLLPINDILSKITGAGVPVTVATTQVNGEEYTVPGGQPVAAPAPPRELMPSGYSGLVSYEEVIGRVGRDLEASVAGRVLVELWLAHHDEMLELVDRNRRVMIAWHRGGGPAIMQILLRMAADPEQLMPATINGEPPLARIERITTVLHAHASPPLRDALDRARAVLPDPALLTYEQFLAALAARAAPART